MATAKKTPVKTPVAKKAAFPTPTPVKAVAKAAPAAKAPKPVKVADRVHLTRRNGEVVVGKVTEVVDKPNGRWVTVNTGDKKKPVLVTARIGQVVRA